MFSERDLHKRSATLGARFISPSVTVLSKCIYVYYSVALTIYKAHFFNKWKYRNQNKCHIIALSYENGLFTLRLLYLTNISASCFYFDVEIICEVLIKMCQSLWR